MKVFQVAGEESTGNVFSAKEKEDRRIVNKSNQIHLCDDENNACILIPPVLPPCVNFNHTQAFINKSHPTATAAHTPQIIKSGWRFKHTLLCFLFTLVWICGVVMFVTIDKLWLLLTGAALYYLECLTTSFTKIFRKAMSLQDFNKLYNKSLEDKPDISFKAASFGMVSSMKSTTSSTPQKQTQPPVVAAPQGLRQMPQPRSIAGQIKTRQEIYSEQRSFDFGRCENDSLDNFEDIIEGKISSEGMCFVNAQLEWRCGDSLTLSSFSTLQEELLSAAKRRSADIEHSTIVRLSIFPSKHILVYAKGRAKSKCFNRITFAVLSCLGMSLAYRLYYLNSHKTLRIFLLKAVFS